MLGRKSRTGTRQTKEITLLKLCLPFVGFAPVRLLRPNMAVLYHVNGKLQRAYSGGSGTLPFFGPV